MDRRTSCWPAGGLLAAPLAAEAQTAGKVYRVGLIFPSPPVSEMAGPEPINDGARAFVRGLRTLGYVEGRNLVLERRSAEGRFERFAPIVAELVSLNVDVIVVTSTPLAQRAREVTTTERTAEISLPVAITVFPGEIYRAPETWARRAYQNLIYFNEVDKGGHFAAWEQPEIFSQELRAAFRSLR